MENRLRVTLDQFAINKLKCHFPHADNTKEMLALESKCEELSVQVERLTTEKETAREEIKRLKDQVKFCYFVFILMFTTILSSSRISCVFKP